ncbi:MAG: alpha/beta fold hydrolase [Acidimicrobiales bacterium]|nr:alpha/beta fold hydrolase [Acidimicrobiales bacterium]
MKTRLDLNVLALFFLISVASCGSHKNPLENITQIAENCPGEAVPTQVSVNCYKHETEDSNTAFAILKSPNDSQVPILFLHGGPGGRSIMDRHIWLAPRSKILNSHDLILIDQKGSGESEPSLDCWEVDQGSTEHSISACKTRLSLEGINFSSYQVREIAEDIVQLRISLGIKQWNLYGVSFGSRIALELMSIDEEAVNTVVLDSPLPSHVAAYDSLPSESERAINLALDSCQKISGCDLSLLSHGTSDCSNAQNLLSECLSDLLIKLKSNPIMFSDDKNTISVNDSVFAFELVTTLAHPDGKNTVPTAVMLAINGRMAEAMDSLLKLNVTGYSKGDELSEGVQFSSECLDELPKNNPIIEPYSTPLASALSEREAVLQEICAIWTPGENLAREYFPQSFKTETLILSGLLDPITPASWSLKTEEILPNSILMQRKNWTHAPSLNDTCAKELVYKFFNGDRWSAEKPPC